MGTAVNGAADIPRMVFGTPGRRHDMDATAVPRMAWPPQHTPNMGPRASLCHDPALAFSIANRFLNMFVGVLSHDILRCFSKEAPRRMYFALYS